MTDKFRNKYRISSTRLQTWDYGNKGAYFITICTRNNVHFFGEIVDEQMQLNEIGKIAEQEWIKTPEIRSDMNLELGEFVVMPNHFHGILIIGENQYNKTSDSPCIDAMHGVYTNKNGNCKNDLGQQMDTQRRYAMHGVSTNKNGDCKNDLGQQMDTQRRDAMCSGLVYIWIFCCCSYTVSPTITISILHPHTHEW